jgi:hypothetical protein
METANRNKITTILAANNHTAIFRFPNKPAIKTMTKNALESGLLDPPTKYTLAAKDKATPHRYRVRARLN